MRTLFRWALKFAFGAFLYAGFQAGFDVPDTVLGLKVPASVKRALEGDGQVKDLAAQADGKFKAVSDAFDR